VAQTDSLPAQRRNINFADNPETTHRPCPLAPNAQAQPTRPTEADKKTAAESRTKLERTKGGAVGWSASLGF